MPRMGRVVLPKYPHHITQRGHDRNVVFAAETDYRYYLDTLAEFKEYYEVKVFAYCLMTNHVHLLLAPLNEKGLSQLMKRLAGRQTRFRNAVERRSGTLWEGRYKSSLVDEDQYLLACVRYIELNPVRAGMVLEPEDYIWSSYRIRTGLEQCSWIDQVPGMEIMMNNNESSAAAYSAYVKSAIPEGEWEMISTAVARNQLTGGGRFIDEINQIIGRRIESRGPGRPNKYLDK